MPEREVGGGGPEEEPPPILGRWSVLYALVIGALLLMIGVCGALTRWGAR